jgi:ethanolamine utilization cobalamin adenosyltransferase
MREIELLAVRIFGPREAGAAAPASENIKVRDDIILALNRLSSALWLLFCRYVKSH